MSTLKELRTSLRTAKSTQKITSAMKMIATNKWRRARQKSEAVSSFALGLGEMMERLLAQKLAHISAESAAASRRILIVVTSDRGLCGEFNSGLVKKARQLLAAWDKEGIGFGIVCLGRKGKELLMDDFGEYIHYAVEDLSQHTLTWEKAEEISLAVTALMETQNISQLESIYRIFRSALFQQIVQQTLVPYKGLEKAHSKEIYQDIIEPTTEELQQHLSITNLTAQIYRILCDSTVSEHGARMVAMDNATRNAQEMINHLQLMYNRTRQALITEELIEVISGAQALASNI